MAEKIAKEWIKRGRIANKKELLELAANAKRSLLETTVNEVFEADTNKVRQSQLYRPQDRTRFSTGFIQDGNIDMEEWKSAVSKNSAIKSLINPSRSVYCIQETVEREKIEADD